MDVTYVSWGSFTPGWHDHHTGDYDETEDTYHGELYADGRMVAHVGGDDDEGFENFVDFLSQHYPVEFHFGENSRYPYREDIVSVGDGDPQVQVYLFEGCGVYDQGILAYADDRANHEEYIRVALECLKIPHGGPESRPA